ncbi:recombinase family protein [Vibrio parahaemolyticus]|uniref:recombinase family protein n=1 Tax=Vibrio parahaemolyticus TaxID=670 RepID=UPI0008137C87|nr:recombinase family protein [Vibrio parahaemolyticus]OCP62907.1 hypothetical protein AKH04_04875 [Vibrio parahaemolyticus]
MSAKKYLIQYHRVSDPSQLKASGMQQQKAPDELIQNLCTEYDLEVYPKVFDDRGHSAFKDAGERKGYGELLKLLEDDIHPDSVLVVLNQDRLSRQGVFDAQSELMGILRKCRIYVMHDNRLLDRNSDNIMGDLILSLANAQRAFSESDAKSKRVKAAIRIAIQKHNAGHRGKNGKPLVLPIGSLPWWFKKVGNEVYLDEPIVVAVKDAITKLIDGEAPLRVKQYLDQTYTPPARLGRGKVDGWSIDAIKKLHTYEQLIGKLVLNLQDGNQEVKDYLEPIISEKTYYQLVNARTQKRARRETKSHSVHIFTGYGKAHCRGCGGTMSSTINNGVLKIRCSNGLNKRIKCDAPVNLVGNGFKDFMVNEVLKNLGSKSVEGTDSNVPVIEAKITSARNQLNELVELFDELPSRALAEKLQGKELELDQLLEELHQEKVVAVAPHWEPITEVPTGDVELRKAFETLLNGMKFYRHSDGSVVITVTTTVDVNFSFALRRGKLVKQGYITGTSDGELSLRDDQEFHRYVLDGSFDRWLSE